MADPLTTAHCVPFHAPACRSLAARPEAGSLRHVSVAGFHAAPSATGPASGNPNPPHTRSSVPVHAVRA
jgi:hypothetical protein